ncbi:HNH endonuclease [Flavobacterium rhamnosiphilum]|uniref:HNH endonuclease n=1 Tax=Flavobacterium rhamnosiphilum TaxID=2541724 RepID=A0A4R5F6D8_9FLAO|nr:HNH endonuclease [Flavobacterium rhamnosiphilum]TDE43441.1 HNH endonuclease [Flavobacterium rhamnosiphilum]
MECIHEKMKSTDMIIAQLFVCSNCNYETVEYPSSCCFHPQDEPVIFYKDETDYYTKPESYTVYNQCKSCGRKNGSALKKSNYNKAELAYFDNSIREKTEKLKQELREHLKEMEIRRSEKRRDAFWDDYGEYLKSDEWKLKRKLVLERDKNLCQSCLNATAYEVHHTVGIFRKNEPLFTLVSLCNPCHNIITAIERGNHKDAAKIQHKK